MSQSGKYHSLKTSPRKQGPNSLSKVCLKSARQIARKVATQILCRAHFNPRYVWKNGIIGSVRMYVGLEDEHEENWTALFVDLIYVAMCSKLAHTFLTCEMNLNLFLWTATLMQIFFFSRFFLDEYNIRFETDDLFHRMLTFLYIFGICIMLVNINFSPDGEGGAYRRLDEMSQESAFSPVEAYQRMLAATGGAAKPVCSLDAVSFHALSYGFYMTRVALLLLYVGIMLIDQSHRVFYMFSIRVIAYICSIIFIVITDLVVEDPHQKVYPLLCAVACELLGYISGGIIVVLKKAGKWTSLWGTMYFPINYLVAQQRIAIYILVVLGESMLMLLLPKWTLPAGSNGYLAIWFSLLLVFMFAMQYFDQVVKGKSEMHAARRDIVAGYIFNMLHGPLGYALLVVSSSVYTIATTWEDRTAIPQSERYNLCVSTFVAGLTMQIMRMTHKGFVYHFQEPRRIAHAVYRFVVICFHLEMIYVDLTPLLSIAVHSVLVFIPVGSDLFFHYLRGDAEINVHRQRRATMVKLKSTMQKMSSNEQTLALTMASGAPMERKRASLIALQAYNPNDMSSPQHKSKDDSDNESMAEEEDAGNGSHEHQHQHQHQHAGTASKAVRFNSASSVLEAPLAQSTKVNDSADKAAPVAAPEPEPEHASAPATPQKNTSADVPSSTSDASPLGAPADTHTAATLTLSDPESKSLREDNAESDDDVMDEVAHQARLKGARNLQNGRASQQKSETGKKTDSGWTASSMGGDTEEEQLENLAWNLAEGNLDDEFVERFSRASQAVKRLSMQNLDIDTLLSKADKIEREVVRSRAATTAVTASPTSATAKPTDAADPADQV